MSFHSCQVNRLIDRCRGRYAIGKKQLIYSDSENVPLVHVDFTYPYSGPLRRALLAAAQDISADVVDGGCIGVFQGPRLESAAEIEKARRDGCDMAGMTSLPEAGLARELGLDYAGIAVVSNWAAGVSGELLSEEDIAETLKEPMVRVRKILRQLMSHLTRNGERS